VPEQNYAFKIRDALKWLVITVARIRARVMQMHILSPPKI